MVEQLKGVKSKVGGGEAGVDGGVRFERAECEREIGVLKEEARVKEEVIIQLTGEKSSTTVGYTGAPSGTGLPSSKDEKSRAH